MLCFALLKQSKAEQSNAEQCTAKANVFNKRNILIFNLQNACFSRFALPAAYGSATSSTER